MASLARPDVAVATVGQEFTVDGAYVYDRRGPVRWVLSHVARSWRFALAFMLLALLTSILTAAVPTLAGQAFDSVLDEGGTRDDLARIALLIAALVLVRGIVDLVARLSIEVVSKRLARDAREELYADLLGKSQTFHNRQRVGDVMARASNDMTQLSSMIVPGIDLIFDSLLSVVIPLVFIAFLEPQLIAFPLLWVAAFALALRNYAQRLEPVAGQMRARFGEMNAGLNESLAGIEVVKSAAQEHVEQGKLAATAAFYRDAFVRHGEVQSRYLPPLLLSIATVGALVHGSWLVSRGTLSIGQLVTYLGLVALLEFASHISVFTFSLVQLGLAGARRVLEIMTQETELDENAGGYSAPLHGEIRFEGVSFAYDGAEVLRDVSFSARPGQTVAIVGQTGSGKSTLTKLVNRIYDVSDGQVLVDGVDVREWQLDALRSQVATIEQDVFLFSRSIAENIGFSLGDQLDMARIEQAALDAQAHDFIMSFRDGYDTQVGDRGVTLSGGQRQRIAIARALLTDPKILILDDSTSAIDSATEDDIQRAIRRLQEERTTLLITHRLSQIRWADWILVLQRGALIDQGTHAELLARCDLYRRIFAHSGPTGAVHADHAPLTGSEPLVHATATATATA